MWHAARTSLPFDEPGNIVTFRNRSSLAAWKAAWCHLRSVAQPDGLGALLPNSRLLPASSIHTEALVRRASIELPRLVASTRNFAIARSLAAAVPLVGAGPGLTPSWDDLLIGYICGLRATASGDPRRTTFLSQFGAAIQKASSATTDVSRWYLQQTIAGNGPPWIRDVLDAIGTGDLARAHRSTQSALHVGNTSGTDMMLGAILGCSVWQTGTQAAKVLTRLSSGRLHDSTPWRDVIHATR